MVDKLSPQQRSENMRRIRGKDTAPELAVRHVLSEAHVRYRLHRKDLPGRPDISITRLRTAVFVHGCFWHQHEGCSRRFIPATHGEFWSRKMKGNIDRDADALERLKQLGWDVQVIWECETSNDDGLRRRLAAIIKAYEESAGWGAQKDSSFTKPPEWRHLGTKGGT
jgi:DNA mismatch endonuclease (patch repair protein)